MLLWLVIWVSYTKTIQYTELLWLVIWDKLATLRLFNNHELLWLVIWDKLARRRLFNTQSYYLEYEIVLANEDYSYTK